MNSVWKWVLHVLYVCLYGILFQILPGPVFTDMGLLERTNLSTCVLIRKFNLVKSMLKQAVFFRTRNLTNPWNLTPMTISLIHLQHIPSDHWVTQNTCSSDSSLCLSFSPWSCFFSTSILHVLSNMYPIYAHVLINENPLNDLCDLMQPQWLASRPLIYMLSLGNSGL